MTVMAVNPQVRAGTGSTPAQTAGTRGANSVPPAAAAPKPPASPRPRRVPLTPMRDQAAKSMSRLADQMHQAHPDGGAHQHVRDAARVLKAGNEEAAQRHLRAAIFSLTPQSLMRQGVHDDTGHMAARHAMHGVHRHLLLVKDIQDVAAKNQAAIRRDSYGDYEYGPSLPHSPVRADPNAGYGPGALAQKPTARQPGGDRALNAPDRTNSGGSDPAVADPVGPQPRGSKQFARTWDEVCRVLDLAGAGDLQPHLDAIDRFRERIEAGDTSAILDMERYTDGLDAKTARRLAAYTDAEGGGPGAGLSWDDAAAVIALASSGGHHVAGTPDTYSHGWKLRDIGGGKKELYGQLPTADKMSKTALKYHLDSHHNGGMPIGGRRIGPRNPSREHLLATHEAMHADERLSVNPPGSADNSALQGGLSRTSRAHTHGNTTGMAYGWDDLAGAIELVAGRPKAR